MSETTTRLPRRRLRAWHASGGAVQMSATPEGADETAASPVWEVPAGDVAEAMAVLSAVVDPSALDLKTQRDAMAHELENAKRALADAEARAYSQGVEDMRQEAAQAMQVEYGLLAARVIDGLSVSAQTPAPAPRDSHMTSEVRSLVKRYGAPAIAAEAARQAKEEGR